MKCFACIVAVVLGLGVLAYGHGNQGGPVKHGNQGHTNQTELMATTFDATIYGSMPTNGWLGDGVVLFSVPLFDNVLIPGDDIIDGIFWAPLGLIIETNTCSFDTLENTVVEFLMTKAKKISVTCGDGYYACCTCQDGCALALCRSNSDPDPVYPCEGGGRGSPGCSIECNHIE